VGIFSSQQVTRSGQAGNRPGSVHGRPVGGQPLPLTPGRLLTDQVVLSRPGQLTRELQRQSLLGPLAKLTATSAVGAAVYGLSVLTTLSLPVATIAVVGALALIRFIWVAYHPLPTIKSPTPAAPKSDPKPKAPPDPTLGPLQFAVIAHADKHWSAALKVLPDLLRAGLDQQQIVALTARLVANDPRSATADFKALPAICKSKTIAKLGPADQASLLTGASEIGQRYANVAFTVLSPALDAGLKIPQVLELLKLFTAIKPKDAYLYYQTLPAVLKKAAEVKLPPEQLLENVRPIALLPHRKALPALNDLPKTFPKKT
jgi:hypothetical protein